MKKTRIIFWVVTGLLAVMVGIGAVYDAISAPEAIAHVTRIGYPAYIVPFLGVAKILGVIAILVPGYPRIKEWAYAGIFYDLFGAFYSHIAFGDGPDMWAPFIIGFALIAVSYIYSHKLQRQTFATA
ncbi:DoxX family protein [Dyadobacter jiangsuensis]|uniref:DoxX-like protein n=1 Tax=Dyadobacter jiangsuensis TaxID=1591085 RepID=A0A2P8FMK3_9BACT|nr:DoxX family protein [Dyadobacter jiangsuensis]PSL22885.1 DoxX-like protein [Dyadobacter jiangsuensis]